MSRKRARVNEFIAPFMGRELDPHYLAFFDCFNRGLYFEAHELLEVLWLVDRSSPDGAFYKGLIQLSGAFVHLQKERMRPAAALFNLARANLEKYPPVHEHLDLAATISLISEWQRDLETGELKLNPLHRKSAPMLKLCDEKQ